MKYFYSKYLEKNNDTTCIFGLEYCLFNKKFSDHLGNDKVTDITSIECARCKFIFYVCSTLSNLVNSDEMEATNETKRDAIEVINNSSEKFSFYMAHKARCQCQQEDISKIEDKIKKICISSDGKTVIGILICDFKMKFEPQRNRETTLAYYRKLGIEWHSVCLCNYTLRT